MIRLFELKRYALLLLLITTIGCSKAPLDYSKADMWYDSGERTEESVDVFYILPTSVLDWYDADGNIHHNADVTDPKQRDMMRGSYEIAREIFSENSNFYAPYYRQVTIESWLESDSILDARFETAILDVRAAFSYFMANKNQGRPFIIAGFSQGARCVKELLKTMDDEHYSRLIAAYAIGFYITEEELADYKRIIPAKSATDIGVTVSYNSVDNFEDMTPAIKRTEFCINPVNWLTDATPAAINDTVTATIDTINNILIIDGLNPDNCYRPQLKEIFPRGCYHTLELPMYKEFLKQNVADRVAKYREIHKLN